MAAITGAWRQQNPTQKTMEYGGAETQRLYEQFAAAPMERNGLPNKRTCSYCRKASATPLKACSRCKAAYFCDRTCQKQAWKGHKLVCKDKDDKAGRKKPARLPLTWAQLEAFGPQGAPGREIVLRVLVDESMMRQVLQCKDNDGVVKRVAAYTDARCIDGAVPGAVLRWRNPRFHHFMDGSDGARIEQEDLENVMIESA